MDLPVYDPRNVDVRRTYSGEIKRAPTAWEQLSGILAKGQSNAQSNIENLVKAIKSFGQEPTIDGSPFDKRPGIPLNDVLTGLMLERIQNQKRYGEPGFVPVTRVEFPRR